LEKLFRYASAITTSALEPPCVNPLQSDMRQSGKYPSCHLPDCRMSLCKGFTQGGSNADVVMADAYLKKVPGIDTATFHIPVFWLYLCILDNSFICSVPVDTWNLFQIRICTYRHEGYLPDCRMSLCKGFTQGGSNADVVMADAYEYSRGFSNSASHRDLPHPSFLALPLHP
jgi:putative alpha-1,2-mannosidase